MWLSVVTGHIWLEMTTWVDIRDLPNWPDLTCISPEKRAAELKQIMRVRKVHLNIDGESPKKNRLLVLSLTDSSSVGANMFVVEWS